MFSKVVTVLLVATSIVFIDCRPQTAAPATEVIKEQLFRSEAFSNLIQTIWQQVMQEYARPPSGTNQTPPPFPNSPPSFGGGSQTKMTIQTFGNQQVNVDKVKAALFSSETFNHLISQIWEQISTQYATPRPGAPPQTTNPPPPTNVDGTINIDAVKASIFSSQSFNSLIQQIWQQISSQYINSEQHQIKWNGSGGQVNNQQTSDQAAALNAKYSFGTEIVDNINGAYQMREEKRENGKLVGSYAYDNGHVYRTVHYEADDKGFRIVSDQSVPSVVAHQARSGEAQVKTYRDGSSGYYQIKTGGTAYHQGPGQASP